MMQPFRLGTGGRIDRARPLRFVFDGRPLGGFAGDTLASALLANGIHFVGRSFKQHRPRGIFTAGEEEPNAIVELGTGGRTEPNARATEVELFDGLVAAPVNAWPSLRFDLGALARLASPLLVAGFYYKTFKGPLWQPVFEPAIRRMAGLGSAPEAPDPDSYDKRHRLCDVLVVGGGPAGLAAALAARRAGADVVLVERDVELGGELLDRAPAWVAEANAALAGATVLTRTTVFAYYDGNYLTAVQHFVPETPGPREILWSVRAKRVVLATGAHERHLVFPGNDRPGVMLASAARAYARRWAVAPGGRGVVFTNNDDGLVAARDLVDAGVGIAAVLDARAGEAIVRARGRRRVSEVETASGARIECDFVALSGGWNPAVHLFSQSQGKLRWDAEKSCFVPGEARQDVQVAGSANGTFSLRAAIDEGARAGAEAARLAGFGDGTVPPLPDIAEEPASPSKQTWLVRGGHDAFVDLQTDATADDIRLSAQEGLRSVEHMKRYTTAGLGTDQGKTGNTTAFALLAEAVGKSPGELGTTTFRPPYTPVTFGVLAGRDRGELSDPIRTTPLHRRHVALGAVFEDVGQWKRPHYFPRPGEGMAAAVARECRAVRNDLGVLDASTLGKIELTGPDVGVLLDRIYTGTFSTLGIGRCRYGVMCRDDGMVFDDGVTARLSEDRWLMTTTTGNAARVLDWLEEYLQTEWPELRVFCTSVTEQWATVTVAGPRARAVLGLPEMPAMRIVETTVAGLPARVSTISFTGGPSYEVAVAARDAVALWDAVIDAGATPFGTETMHVLRAEMGYFIVGQETDGSVTPLDLGLDRMVAAKDFLGRRALRRPDTSRPDRKQLVGLLPADERLVVPEGAQILFELPARPPTRGHVTSSYHSPALGRSFALAMVEGGRARVGETVQVYFGGRTVPAQLVAPRFVKPDMTETPGSAIAPLAPSSPTPSLLALRGTPDSFGALGLSPPTEPNTVVERDGTRLLWLGPDEFLLVAAEERAGPLRGAAGGVIDVSCAYSIVALGAGWRELLALGCKLDLRDLGKGRCARTLAARAGVIIEPRGEDEALLYVRPSFETYLRRWLGL